MEQTMEFFFMALCGWMPTPIMIICSGVVVMFFTLSIASLIKLILDVIPFL